MIEQLGERPLKDLSRWELVRLFFLPLRIEHDVLGWQYIYYKIYRGRKIILYKERYH